MILKGRFCKESSIINSLKKILCLLILGFISITVYGKQPNLYQQPSSLYNKKLLSLNFQDISTRGALHLLADIAKINIIISASVHGHLSLRLTKVTWNQALNVIAQTQGLGTRHIGNVLFIAPAKDIIIREQQLLNAKQAMQQLQPLKSAILQIHYGNAAELANIIQGRGNSVLAKHGTIHADTKTNTLWVLDTPDKLKFIKQLVHRLDKPIQQVAIQARIVNFDRHFEHELGIRWGFTKPNQLSGTLAGASNMRSGTPASNVPFQQRLNFDLPAAGVGQLGGATSIGLALARLSSNVLLDLELSALESEGDAKIISSPHLVTANQKLALIETGSEIPFQESTSSGATAVTFKKAVLSLKVTPQITPDKRIILSLQVNQDKRGTTIVNNIPEIDTREIKTQVLVNNGQTIVLGGIYQKNSNNSVERVPFLGSLPIIGYLFRHTRREIKKTELLIFVTPRIVQ